MKNLVILYVLWILAFVFASRIFSVSHARTRLLKIYYAVANVATACHLFDWNVISNDIHLSRTMAVDFVSFFSRFFRDELKICLYSFVSVAITAV